MFTGIIECFGNVLQRQHEGTNVHFRIQSEISSELKVDQSISHNGVCLTVTRQEDDWHEVTAIEETLQVTSLGALETGSRVNLERAMKLGDRLDGHIVQGHVDATARLSRIENEDGSWRFYFDFDAARDRVLVPKGSICVDGVSLTVVDAGKDNFSVAIIPYTYEHTKFADYQVGDSVNLEFDVIGKYVARLMEAH
jgi:riboflavin synthase